MKIAKKDDTAYVLLELGETYKFILYMTKDLQSHLNIEAKVTGIKEGKLRLEVVTNERKRKEGV